MITSNVFHRVFQIRTETGTATAFTIDHNERQYVVTAKHVAMGNQATSGLQIYHEAQWKFLEAELVGHADGEIDISVLAPSIQISPTLELPATTHGIVFGQDLYFLGFPYGLKTEVGPLNRQFPLPLVKKGILSALLPPTDGAEILLIDGHNNHGFSGGPVVYSQAGANPQYKVAGVISGYRSHAEPIFHAEQQTPLMYHANTGIVVAYSIRHAIDLIDSNPIGVPVLSRDKSV